MIIIKRQKRDLEEMFNDYIEIKHSIQSLASIVQNPNMKLTNEDFSEFTELHNKVTNKLQNLRLDVLHYYEQY